MIRPAYSSLLLNWTDDGWPFVHGHEHSFVLKAGVRPPQSRKRLRAQCAQLIRDSRARDAATNGTANGKHDVSIRTGCKPGSFMDLLIHATNKQTGQPFTDTEERIAPRFLIFVPLKLQDPAP